LTARSEADVIQSYVTLPALANCPLKYNLQPEIIIRKLSKLFILTKNTIPYSIGRFPVRLLGTRFNARNCISEPCPQEPYMDIF
jgi:hypothetical protein